jgi:aminoglycoside phosphotransferase (APT) family kinase protein
MGSDVGDSALVAEVNERTGCGLTFVGTAVHGESGGAAYVRWPDGRPGVVTRSPIPIERARLTGDVLAELRSGGLPVPRYDAVAELADGTAAIVQERLPGEPARRTDVAVIEAMLALNERFAGLLAGRRDVPVPPLYLRQSGPDFPRHETLAGYDDRSRRMLRRILEVGAGEPHEMTGDDLVHTDFTVPNVLFDESGQVTGVVDWNFGIARGDRRFGLVKLRFDLTWAALDATGAERAAQQAAIDRVDAALAELEPALLRMYWAHWTLYQLHWAIRSGARHVIELHLRLGERLLG